VYPPVSDEWVAEIAAVAPQLEVIVAADAAEAQAAIREADAFYGSITPNLLAAAQRLRWIQAPRIGLEHTIFPALAQSDVVMTNMRGIYSDVIADHVMGYVLSFARGFHTYVRQQLDHSWRRDVPVIHLADATLGIIGLGGIGIEVAHRAAAFGMRVVAVDPRRREAPDTVAALWRPERLDDLLACADFCVICAPHTPETAKMIGAAQLRRMKRTAYLINIGRGIIVDLSALTAALQEGVIAGAGLDVFEVEPLPADHPLWALPNVIITSHSAYRAAGGHIESRRLQTLLDNVRRFADGKPLRNVVDKSTWF
jgi:phosphoglycerate dehydrogenase-like enzyme